MFTVIMSVYSKHLHQWMKIQFSDVYSSGDKVIRDILDDLNDFYNKKKLFVS